MFRRIVTLAASASALALAPAAHALETLEVAPATATRSVTVSSSGGIGQSFTAFTDTLTSVGFQFTTLNPSAANSPLTLRIFSGEALSGTSLFSSTFTLPGTITSRDTFDWVDIAVPDLALTQGNLYSLVLTATTTRAAVRLGPGFVPQTGQFLGGDAYTDGKLLTNWRSIYANCTGTANNCDLNFRVAGNLVSAPVPEPSTWLTMLLGVGAIGAAMRRTRKGTPVLAKLA